MEKLIEMIGQVLCLLKNNSVIIGNFITIALIYYTNKNIQKTISSNSENIKSEQAFRRKQEEKKMLHESLEKISKSLEQDFSNLKFAINNLRTGGVSKLDENGGYVKNLVDAKVLSRMYFPDLHKKIVDYEKVIDSYFLIELASEYKKNEDQINILNKDTEEITNINIAYEKIENALNNEIDRINSK